MSNVPQHGNYRGYYTKRPSLNDPRLSVLPPGLFKNGRVLDVGCNEGWVTNEIAQSYGAKLVVGVDIDNSMIEGAWRRRRAVWSLEKFSFPQATLCESPQTHYFPLSCGHEFGFLPIPPAVNRGKDVFPHNLSFRTADWIRVAIPEDKDGYDAVVGFSITKWIHLNDGDEGLEAFFKRVFDVLKPGGKFVLEPQPWDSYGKAKRGNTKLKEKAASIRIKPEEFRDVLERMGFRHASHFMIGDDMHGFCRPIDIYIKQ